jgi:hypothetical protein
LSTVAGFYIFLALAAALAFSAVGSYLLLRYRGPKGIVLEASPTRLRLVKHERAPISLSVISRGTRWFTLSSASAPQSSGLVLKHEPKEDPGAFMVVADYAGRYERLELKVTFVDVLGLFKREERVRPEDFAVEVLPLSILASPRRSAIFAMTTGETPAGSRGSGQEFYGIEEYGGMSDSKDILWKRVAKTSTEEIVSRIREANVPQSLKVALIESREGDRTFWMDTVTEALGRIGVTLLGLGVGLDVLTQTSDGEVSLLARNMDELVELVIGVWKEKGVPELVGEASLSADLVIAGSGAMATHEVYSLSESMPTLVVLDAGRPAAMGARSKILADTFEFENFISWVAVR